MRAWQVLLATAMLMTAALPGGTAFAHSVEIAAPTDGATVSGVILVSGTAHADDGVTHILIGVDGNDLVQVDEKDGTTDVIWSHTIDTTAYPSGDHTIVVRARDSGGSMAEDRIDIRFDNPVVVDLWVAHVESGGGLAGDRSIRAWVANSGSAGAVGVVAAAQYAYQGGWHDIGRTTFDISAGEETFVDVPWSSSFHVGRFPVRVTLDPDGAIPEANESNNVGEGEVSFWTDLVPGVWLLWPTAQDPQTWQTKIVHIQGQTLGYVAPVSVVRVTDYLIFWNEDTVLHTVTADDGSFDTGEIEPGSPDVVVFDAPGTYGYHCTIHPGMRGTVVVVG